jgi:hypothetical protein
MLILHHIYQAIMRSRYMITIHAHHIVLFAPILDYPQFSLLMVGLS